jgi:hypothetical protein
MLLKIYLSFLLSMTFVILVSLKYSLFSLNTQLNIFYFNNFNNIYFQVNKIIKNMLIQVLLENYSFNILRILFLYSIGKTYKE